MALGEASSHKLAEFQWKDVADALNAEEKEATFEVSESLGIRLNEQGSGCVVEVHSDSTAYGLGVQKNWRIIRLDGIPFDNELLRQHRWRMVQCISSGGYLHGCVYHHGCCLHGYRS